MPAIARSAPVLAPDRDVTSPSSLLAAARLLLARSGCTVLLVERIVRAERTTIRIDGIAVDGCRIPGVSRADEATAYRLGTAANALLRPLAQTWAGHALPPRLGLMTDGTGILFSADRPSVCGDDWIGQAASGAIRTMVLAQFDPYGNWARLCAPDLHALPN